MKVIVFGSTAGTGPATLRALLAAGYQTTAFARDPARQAAIGATRAQLPCAFKLVDRTLLREHMADKEKHEALVRASGLAWTLLHPVGLTDGPATGIWLADTVSVIRRRQISRAAVAAFLVSLVPCEVHARETVSLSG